MKRILFTFFVLVTIWCSVFCSQSGWSAAPNGQYHIQTDEGPERYFRYQTQSGQYRKEKRLQDGTVVGSYGWIDADGYLRLRDYIADNEGYRILKSKTVYVGQNRPIEEAIKSTKKVPPQAGILVKPGNTRPVAVAAYSPVRTNVTPAPTFSSYLPPSTTPAVPLLHNEYLHPSVSPAIVSTQNEYLPPIRNPVEAVSNDYLPPSKSPAVIISHNSIESSTDKPEYDFRPTIAPVAASSITQLPPTYSTTERPISINPSSTTYLPPTSAPSSYVPLETSTPASHRIVSSYVPSRQYVSSTPAPIVAITSNSLGEYRRKYQPVEAQTYRPYIQSTFGDRHLQTIKPLNLDPFSLQSTPIDRSDYQYQRPRTSYRPQAAYTNSYTDNNLGNGYDPQYPQYDGVSVTNNGFRYYLPKQYHEEENSGSDTRAGSFGYIDPFGIRRVIYYNTSPGSGFVHRKNNRYVGLNATPYDPRPL